MNKMKEQRTDLGFKWDGKTMGDCILNEHDVANELCGLSEKILRYKFRHSGTFFDADMIENYFFYDVMQFLLFVRGKEGKIEFLNKIYERCKNKRMKEIPEYKEIYLEFQKLIDTD